MQKDALGYYNILEVDYNADEHTIKLKYREKAKFWHPDHNESDNALEVFQKLSVAYDILKDVKTRAMYDVLSMVYKKEEFPDFNTIKIYKTNDGIENPFLRVFKVEKFTNKGFKTENLVCSFDDAVKIFKETTKINWTKGWIKAKENIKAIKNNRENINKNNDDNFKMLVHNAVAYFKDGKKDKAFISAREAILYANNEQKDLLESFSYLLDNVNYTPFIWDYEYLKNIQLNFVKKICVVVGVAVAILLTNFVFNNLPQNENKSIITDYYQEVRFYSGDTVDDMVLSKVFNIPVDLTDDKMLFYLKSATNIMHGPDENFDVLVRANKNQTVRVTGYTPDETWYRVMIDDGNMGFVKKELLKKGLGDPIPENSKIIENNQR